MHNSMVGNIGVDWTYIVLKLCGHNWNESRPEEVYLRMRFLPEKIKWQRAADWEDLIDHHLYSVTLLQ